MVVLPAAVWKSRFYGAFVLNHRVVLHAIDATPARWRGGVRSSPLERAIAATSSPRNDLVKNCRVHPTHWLISTQNVTIESDHQYTHLFLAEHALPDAGEGETHLCRVRPFLLV